MAMYRRALPHVYGYLLPRGGSVAVAEDLTAETFMAAVAPVEAAAGGHGELGWRSWRSEELLDLVAGEGAIGDDDMVVQGERVGQRVMQPRGLAGPTGPKQKEALSGQVGTVQTGRARVGGWR
jgi:hypothetical protein